MDRFIQFLRRLADSFRPEGLVSKRIRFRYRDGGTLRTLTAEVSPGVDSGPIRIALQPQLVVRGYEFDPSDQIDRPVLRRFALENVFEIEIEQVDVEHPDRRESIHWLRNQRGKLVPFTEG